MIEGTFSWNANLKMLEKRIILYLFCNEEFRERKVFEN
jgi:hypothetical protein